MRPIGDDETACRFVTRKDYVRANGTVKPAAFEPGQSRELSVTLHADRTEAQIWNRGAAVAQQYGQTFQSAKLMGRADFEAAAVRMVKLRIVLMPTPDDPHHSGVVDWPAEKDARMALAQELTELSRYLPCPVEADRTASG